MNVLKSLINPRIYQHVIKRNSSDLYEPSYLADMKSTIPSYEALNIFLKCYDYSVLEKYQKFVHKLLKNMDVEVEDSWGLPAQHIEVTKLKPKSDVKDSQYNLQLYERVVQVVDVTSTEIPLIIRAIEASLPAGVKVYIRPHEEFDEENRYIPDKELNTLKDELDSLGGPLKKK